MLEAGWGGCPQEGPWWEDHEPSEGAQQRREEGVRARQGEGAPRPREGVRVSPSAEDAGGPGGSQRGFILYFRRLAVVHLKRDVGGLRLGRGR